jgi:glutamyl-tRNA synthetase
VELFRLEDMNKSPAFFDVKKLTHFNGEYIRALATEAFVEAAWPFLERALSAWDLEGDRERFAAIAPLVQERVSTLAEVPAMVDFLFRPEPELDDESWAKAVMGNERAPALLDDAIAAFGALPDWRAENVHAALLEVGERHGLKLGKAQAPVRVAVTGRTVGPPLFESLELLGREATLDRLRAARARL